MKKTVASSLGATVFGVFAVAAAEIKFAHRTINAVDLPPPPDPTGWYEPTPGLHDEDAAEGAHFSIALLGDSSASGYGLHEAENTPGARLAHAVAHETGHRVFLRDYSVVGALTNELHHQVSQVLERGADAAIILIGANDVVKMVPAKTSVRFLVEEIDRLREAGIEVVVGTCPDFGMVRPIKPPVRYLARYWSRTLAAEQQVQSTRAGARVVPLAELLGGDFLSQPTVFFGPDKFHPSVTGYAALADALLPATLAALGRLASHGHPTAAPSADVGPNDSVAMTQSPTDSHA